MRTFLAYILRPANILALLFIIALTATGVLYWHEGGMWITLAGTIVLAVFLIGAAVRSSKKKP